MTDPTDYMIGTTYANLSYFRNLAIPMLPPRGDPMDYAKTVTLGDGTQRGVGWLRQSWHWDYLTEAQRNQLYNYIGDVFVWTRKNDGNFGLYTAELVWPDTEPEHYCNRVIDLTVELRKLVVYTP